MIDQQQFGFLQLTEPAPGVVLATLNRPEKLNAIDDRVRIRDQFASTAGAGS